MTIRLTRRAALLGAAAVPAIAGTARAAPMKMRLSSSLPNDPKYANGRVYFDNLVKQLKAAGLDGQIDVQYFPDNQLGQEIDSLLNRRPGCRRRANPRVYAPFRLHP